MTTPKRYRSRGPVEAMGPLTRDNAHEIAEWCGGVWWEEETEEVEFYTEGLREVAQLDDWIVFSDERIFVFSPSLFKSLYEPVEDET